MNQFSNDLHRVILLSFLLHRNGLASQWVLNWWFWPTTHHSSIFLVNLRKSTFLKLMVLPHRCVRPLQNFEIKWPANWGASTIFISCINCWVRMDFVSEMVPKLAWKTPLLYYLGHFMQIYWVRGILENAIGWSVHALLILKLHDELLATLVVSLRDFGKFFGDEGANTWDHELLGLE